MKRPSIEAMRPASLPPRIRLPGQPKPARKPKPRDDLARPLASMLDLAAYVRFLRETLSIQQAEVARRAGVSRQWIVELEQGKPTLAAGKVFRVLETLGFEIVVSPYEPAPPWMLRAAAAAEARQTTLAAGRRVRRNTRRAQARDARLAGNEMWGRVEVE